MWWTRMATVANETGGTVLSMRDLRGVTGYAAEGAQEVLEIFEEAHPADPRPGDAIDAYRRRRARPLPRGTDRRRARWGAAPRSGRDARRPFLKTLLYLRRAFTTIGREGIDPTLVQHERVLEDSIVAHDVQLPNDRRHKIAGVRGVAAAIEQEAVSLPCRRASGRSAFSRNVTFARDPAR